MPTQTLVYCYCVDQTIETMPNEKLPSLSLPIFKKQMERLVLSLLSNSLNHNLKQKYSTNDNLNSEKNRLNNGIHYTK